MGRTGPAGRGRRRNLDEMEGRGGTGMVHASMGDESEITLQHAGSGRGALRWIQWNEIVVVGKLVIYR